MDTSEVMGTCRCCLTTSKDTFQMTEVVFDQISGENGNINASQSYFEITGLAEDLVPDFSLQICSPCKALLETSLTFRKTCLESHKILTSRIKEEPHEEEMICESKLLTTYDIKTELVEEPSLVAKLRRGKIKTKKTKRKAAKKPTDPTVLKSLPLASDEKEVSIDFVTAKFVCMYCDVPARNYAHLIKHRQNHRLHDIRDCKMCGELNCQDYEAHVAAVHPEYRPQQCLSCDATFINHKELKEHLRTHKTAERHQCMACGTNYDSQIALRIHIANKCNSPTHVAYRCHCCGLVVGNLAEVQQHIFEKHPKDFRKRHYPCFHCKRIFTGMVAGSTCKSCQGWLQTTEMKMKAENIFPHIKCEKCDKKFYHDEAYECHKIGSHSSQSYCFECDKVFWTIEEKRAHNKALHPIARIRREKMCDECGKVFLDHYHLKIHLLAHRGKPEFKCSFPGCESAAYSAERLAAHFRRAHKKDYKYECHYCGKRINFYGYIFTHFQRAHFPHLRRFGCDVTSCTRRFASITDKKRHMATHTGETLPGKIARIQNMPSGDQQMMTDGFYPPFQLNFQ